MNKYLDKFKFNKNIKIGKLFSNSCNFDPNYAIKNLKNPKFKFYKFNVFNYARNIKSINLKKISENNYEMNLKNENISNENSIPNDINIDMNIPIPLNKENIPFILKKFHLKAKTFQILSEEPSSFIESNEYIEYVQYYKYLCSNLNIIDEIDIFVRSFCYFQIKDEKTVEILNKLFISYPKKQLENACFILYAIFKLKIDDITLKDKCINIIETGNLKNIDKESMILLLYTLPEYSKKKINDNINEFIVNNISNLNEYEISIAFRFYSKTYYFKYDVLELIIKRCIDFAQTLSLRYIMMITQSLAHLQIRNLNLLSAMMERLSTIIQMNLKKKKNFDISNELEPEFIANILLNFVKLEFLEFENFKILEELFISTLEKKAPKINVIKSIITAHYLFIKKVFIELKNPLSTMKSESIDEVDIDENNTTNKFPDKKEKIKKLKFSIRSRKELKKMNEEFLENILPYIKKEELDFQTISILIITIRNLHINKRKILRTALELYLFSIDKTLNEEKIKDLEKGKVQFFIKNGLILFDSQQNRNLIIESYKKQNLDITPFIEKIKNKTETAKENF